jgi:hypothetical protein
VHAQDGERERRDASASHLPNRTTQHGPGG